jgi:hypothetical protein
MNNYIVTAYCIYIPVLVGLTIWVARTIHRNTGAFLAEIFPAHEKVAAAVNNLLQVGFYLIAFGFGFLRMRIRNPFSEEYHALAHKLFMTTDKELVEALAFKLGGLTLFIGALLFFNLLLMLMLRKGAKNRHFREEQMKYFAQAQAQNQKYPGA